jgi:hypothetical protein
MDIFTLILVNMVYQQHHIEITHLLHQEFFYTKKLTIFRRKRRLCNKSLR